MLSQPIPSRAECTDICNAVLDGVDAVMLAGETAVGTYPIEIMKVTSKIITEAEQYLIQIKANLNLTTLPISLSEITSRTIPEIVTQFEKLHYSGKIIVFADTEY